jgi:predicted nucleic acid-binding Zn ribbon protein
MSRKRPSHISDIIDHSLKKLSLTERLREYRLMLAWPKIVGPAISKRTSPLKLVRGKLYVNVSSQVWMTELLYQKNDIIGRINRDIAADLVSDIIFRPGSVTKAPERKKRDQKEIAPAPFGTDTPFTEDFIDKTVSPVKDKELRELIRRTMNKGGG